MVAMPDGPAMAAATCPVWTFESVKNTFVSAGSKGGCPPSRTMSRMRLPISPTIRSRL